MKEKLKVLQVAGHAYPHVGGIEQVVSNISNVLSDFGAEQKIICFNEDAKDGNTICRRRETVHDTVNGVEVIRCGCFMKVASQCISVTYPKELRAVMNGFSPDVVIFHHPNPYLAHFLLRYHERKFKLLVYYHSDIIKQKVLGKLFRGQTTRLLCRASRVIITSPNYLQGSRSLQPVADKCRIVPCMVNRERLKVTEAVRVRAAEIKAGYADKIMCFCVGRHVEYKGIAYLIRASRRLDDRFRIVIGGHGPLTESLKNEAEGDAKIKFQEHIDDTELIAYYLACDMYAFPSITKNEAFGLTLAEAMFFGKPVITYTIEGSGVNFVSLEGITGLECPNRDVEGYAEAMTMLADDKELRERLGNAAKKRAEEVFSPETYQKNINNVIRELMEN